MSTTTTTIKTTDALSDLFGSDAKIVRTSVVTIPETCVPCSPRQSQRLLVRQTQHA